MVYLQEVMWIQPSCEIMQPLFNGKSFKSFRVWNMFKLNNKDTIATSLKFVWCLYCQLWLFNTSVSIVFVVYFEKACLIKFLFSFRYSQASAPFCELKNQREFFFVQIQQHKNLDRVESCNNRDIRKMLSEQLPTLVSFGQISLVFLGIQLLNLDM